MWSGPRSSETDPYPGAQGILDLLVGEAVLLWGANTTSEPRGEREVATSGSSGRFEESFRRRVGGGGYPDGWNQARTKGIRALINRGLPAWGSRQGKGPWGEEKDVRPQAGGRTDGGARRPGVGQPPSPCRLVQWASVQGNRGPTTGVFAMRGSKTHSYEEPVRGAFR
jgi:hypothetical protein